MNAVAGKSVLISGGAHGMGAGHVRALSALGAYVVFSDVDESLGRGLEREVTTAGGRARFVAADVRSADDWSQAVEYALENMGGRVDVLINNAGVSGHLGGEDADPLDLNIWRRILDVNLEGCFLGCRAVLPQMQRQGAGSIINISSIAGLLGVAWGHPAYSASKGGVRLLTKALAARYGPEGIRVNSVHPGRMPAMLSSGAGSAEQASDGIPLGRVGTTDDVTHAVVFLASEDSAYITGTELTVDGGASCHIGLAGAAPVSRVVGDED
jgi:NAD(P)-dependent dehydrogenase (short-subunit alcohol dehydrogenase family)